MKIAITGASGFIGSLLTPFLRQKGHEVFALSRKKDAPYFWDPAQGKMSDEALSLLQTSDAIIHLSGEDITSKRWSSNQKKALKESRVASTEFLVEHLLKNNASCKIFLQASAVGYYGNRPGEELTEESSPGLGFLPSLAKEWESASLPLEKKGIRRVLLRLGMVLDAKGGPLAEMLPFFKWGLGTTFGSGKQEISWISSQDLLGVIALALEESSLQGPVNAVAPEATSMRLFTKTLGKALHRPTFLCLPKSLIHLFFGEMGDALFLSSTRAVPQKLLSLNYSFAHPTLAKALPDLLNKR